MRCWYTRWQMSNALDRGDLTSRMTRGHAARCAACQSFGRDLEQLDADLSHGARTAAAPRITAPRRRVLPFIAPLAAAAAVVAVLAINGVSPIEHVVEAPGSPSPGPLIEVRHVADRLSRALTRTPLDTELDNLIADGKRGIDAVLAIGGLR
jgi:hypothetical protein